MKSTIEILSMLVLELNKHIDRLTEHCNIYYNDIMGDTSFLLAGLLDSLMEREYPKWSKERWIDDSLISNILLNHEKINLTGIMIYGMVDSNQQWTYPFSFLIEINQDEMELSKFVFSFGDLKETELIYEDFVHNRGYWNGKEIDWKYVISSD